MTKDVYKTLTVEDAVRILKKDHNWIRFGIVSGYLPVVVATRNEEKNNRQQKDFFKIWKD